MPRYLAPLIAVYVLVAVLVLVGAPLAAELPVTPNPPSSSDEAQSGDNGVAVQQGAPAPPAQQAPTPNQQQQQPQQQAPAQDQSPPVAVAASPGSVSIVDFSFSPGSITINANDSVTWTNSGKQGHSATGSGFDTGILSKGQSGSHTFNSPGTFSYHCTPHPFMKGTIVVRAAGTGGGSSGGSGGGSAGSSSAGTGGGASTSGNTASGSAGSSSQGSSAGSSLPATGADVAILAGLGVALLGLGLAIRRRTDAAGGAS